MFSRFNWIRPKFHAWTNTCHSRKNIYLLKGAEKEPRVNVSATVYTTLHNRMTPYTGRNGSSKTHEPFRQDEMAHGTRIFQEQTSLTSRDRKVTDENSNKGKQTENISRISFAFSLLISIIITKIIITIEFFVTMITCLEVLVQIIVLSYKYMSLYLTEPLCGLSICEC